ncbi:MAG TPA: DNA modification methylase, partial [Tissierellia bacterium]|nr:DNA modification methylase [Tissierellia bacterium]
QKKGWFGVERGKPWGTGPKDFMRRLFNREFGTYKNFYDDILEPLFYEALSTNRSAADHYYSRFNCKIPFLNGGLFDPINNYDWVKTDILIPDKLFSNNNKTKEGDIGDGILDVFDRYNFTVNEEEPLEKEVALDPELLGKTYEKLNAIRADNFDEYLQVLQSGRKGEETKFNKEYGVYYTPREIVHYMCQESLINYLATETSCARDDIEEFVKISDSIQEMEATSLVKQELIEAGDIKSTKYESQISECIRNNAKQIDNLLANIKVCDPAVGSGAFPIGMMHEVVKLRQLLSIYTGEQVKTYDLKHHAIENSLYGVDIDPGAVEICKLRFWLSMIVDEEDFHNIKPLPNLDYKIVCGNSLLGVEKGLYNHQDFAELEKLKPKYFSFSETNPIKKQQLKNEIDRLIYKITKGHKEFDFEVYFSEVFREKGGFDIVIANPPYISTKGVSENVKKLLQKYYGFADDLYSHFYFRSMEILKKNGILTYISSKTFWTIQTKKNLRELILKNQLLQLVDAGNPFDAPMVDTCVILVQKQLNSPNNYIFKYIDGTKNFTLPTINEGKIEYYKNVPNNVFFPINEYNLKIYKRYGKKVNELLNQWWTKVSTSKNIEKYKKELETYRKSLKPGDITLLGLITEGGVGIQTGNNGKYVGVLGGTKWAENVRKQRPEKLLLAAKFCSRQGIKNKSDAIDFLNNLNEQEIRELFDELKEKYGRDIFGQGWLFRIISPEEIADVETLTEDEKLNGIFGEKTFVPYDKGDKDGNRWYAPTPYYIDWSRKNVKTLQTDPKARWQGYQFYFREGFCWNNVSTPKNEKSMYIKCRLKEKSVNDVASMSLYIINKNDNLIQNYYLISLLNSRFLFNFLKIFINESVNLQINDIRQLPIIIPTSEQLKFFENIFNQAVSIQKEKFAENINKQEAEENLDKIQKELDKFVEEMYLG